MNNKVYDLIGVGFNVSNIGLAISIKEKSEDISMLFIESNNDSLWQPNMLIPGTDIQNSPHRDLITPINPRSKYTFINYLFEHGRLFEYFNLGLSHPFRAEYARYIKWCAEDFSDHVVYNEKVNSICLDDEHVSGGKLYKLTTTSGKTYRAKNISIGTGREKNIPKEFEKIFNNKVFHLTKYTSSFEGVSMLDNINVAVIGTSQSAIEIVLDLKKRFPNAAVTNISRGFGYRLKDTSPFSYEVFYPEFIDFFYGLNSSDKNEVSNKLRSTNYSAVDSDVLHELYHGMYEDRIVNKERVKLVRNKLISSVVDYGSRIEINTVDKYSQAKDTDIFDYVILATGFKDYEFTKESCACIPLLKDIESVFKAPNGNYNISRDYRLIAIEADNGITSGNIYLNGLCESTHGLGDAGSISSVSIRANIIASSIIENK
ncbi:SidA/IucD/PvdA family monooxygenase [Serratia fonticola]|uniref:SidA/IucD/PvdA family monooxygenase n=1 Tax=Serratia fonticola TaxID=47917 RepID=A0AAW3WNB6_SERFO|nr:SidA/IucD/PvdA family monooxygenase [Serratia fonticola]MBC3212443.1 SidA/IucD/PvdA family monooxygenase [Serratia fonticola]NYA12981.1 SidA/IucD/PvdA family monooxygenase [Serratia fonticola]NYA32559.1 SidA/IucD/PvdA family monooxygenase [Serratia fonticola]